MLARYRSHWVSTSVRVGSSDSSSGSASTSRYMHQKRSHHSAICLCVYGEESGSAPHRSIWIAAARVNGMSAGGLSFTTGGLGSWGITTKLCGANEAQRSLRPDERLVMCFGIQCLRFLVHYCLLILDKVDTLLNTCIPEQAQLAYCHRFPNNL